MKMAWSEVVASFVDATGAPLECLWQDLDGVHIEPVPDHAPPTSIMWAWPAPGSSSELQPEALRRVRIDGQIAYVATPRSGGQRVTLPWGGLDQIAQLRVASAQTADQVRAQVFAEYVEDGTTGGESPVTFFYRTESGGRASSVAVGSAS